MANESVVLIGIDSQGSRIGRNTDAKRDVTWFVRRLQHLPRFQR